MTAVCTRQQESRYVTEYDRLKATRRGRREMMKRIQLPFETQDNVSSLNFNILATNDSVAVNIGCNAMKDCLPK